MFGATRFESTRKKDSKPTTFASRLVMNGVDICTVSKLLRHGNVAASERYAYLPDAHLPDAVER